MTFQAKVRDYRSVEQVLSNRCLRDFADRCRRLAVWEKDPAMRSSLLRKAETYEREAALRIDH
ncbi:MAG TPA: hypothetical protein VF637_09415 [Sphingomicrobium sp.]|jgi:hypothetical protein